VLLKGREATESRLRKELDRARCFHFAGHTQLMPLRPMQTAMLCAPDADHNGRLEVSELFGLDLSNCEIAVLSACETHRGRHGQGDEIVGLSRAFLRAGVPTVIASFWRVPDEATFRLMVRFHEVRLNSRKPPLEALALAQREYIANGVQEVRLSGLEVAAINQRKKELAQARGLVIESPNPVPAPGRAHPYYWAAFALLGDGG
jgi:CHAT domain-containing protein